MQEQGAKAQDTHNAILDAAIELFISEGFEKTPMDDIASAAKVAKGTLYYHFASKEGIVDAIVERYTSEVEARLSAVASNMELGFVEKLGQAGSVIAEVNNAHFGKLHRMKYIDIHHKTLRAMVEHGAPYFARIIEDGNKAGLCSVEYPFECAEIVLAASQYLLDPESGAESFPRRIKALARLSASIFGMDPKVFERIYQVAENVEIPSVETTNGGNNNKK
jgi:AcrR family transcriptional regulator